MPKGLKGHKWDLFYLRSVCQGCGLPEQTEEPCQQPVFRCVWERRKGGTGSRNPLMQKAKSCREKLHNTHGWINAWAANWGPWVVYFGSCTGCKFWVCSRLPLHILEQRFFFPSHKKQVAVSESSSWKPNPDCHDCKCSQSLERRLLQPASAGLPNKRAYLGTLNALFCSIAR